MEDPILDYQAIARPKRGDLSRLDTLMEQYQLLVVRTAYLIVCHSPLVEDILQTTFLWLAQDPDACTLTELLAASDGKGNIQLWDMNNRKLLTILSDHHSEVAYLVFSPDGCWLAASDANGIVQVWGVDE